MKKRLKKMTAVFLAVVLLSLMIPFGTGSISAAEISNEPVGATQSEAVAWVNSKIGTWVGSGQCVALIEAYASYLGLSISGGNGNACDYTGATNISGTTRINNYSGFVPQPGDICVWGSYAWLHSGWQTTNYGHIGIVLSADASNMITVECNLDAPYEGGICKKVTQYRPTSYVTCFLRPNFAGIVIPSGSQTISDGDYHIVTMLDDNKALDVYGADTNNGANIDIYSNTNRPEQVFTIRYLGNGCYKIIHRYSGKSLDCQGAGTTPHTNVQTWAYDGSDQQQWILQPTEDNGSFYIISKKSGLCLDVNNASSEDFTNVQIFTPNQTTAQKWKFISWGADIGRTVSDGEYHISTKMNPEMCLDVYGANTGNNTNIDLYNNISSPEQVFIVSYLNDGYYKIINKYTGKSLDIDGGKCVSGTNIQQFDFKNVDQQKWIIKPTSDGKSFNIISKKGGLCIDIQDGIANNFNNIQAHIFNGSNAQKWNFIAWSDESQNDLKSGYYQIITQIDDSKVVSVSGDSYSDNANIIIDNNTKRNSQSFTINYIGQGYYTIINKETGKSLDCNGAGCISGTNVQQFFYDNVNQQKWIIKKTGNQTYNIISKASGLYLTVDNNANINVQVNNNEQNQQWIIQSSYKTADANLDGAVNINDVTAIQRHVAEYELLTEEQLAAADTNSDGSVTIEDATYLQDYLAEFIDSLA